MVGGTRWLVVPLGLYIVVVCGSTFVSAQSNHKDSSFLVSLVGDTFLALESLARNFTTTFTLNDVRRTRSIMSQKRMPKGKRFMCETRGFRSETPPRSVHRLMPGDIDVIAAMGDSLTAGNGAFATNLAQLLINDRGISWSIGGQDTWRSYLTLPNILKEYNPRLTGYSLGKGYSYSRIAQLNVAVTGAIDDDIVYQAKVLVQRMRNDPKVDMKNHWKIITMTIGSNDICIFICQEKKRHSAEMHLKAIREALDYLHENVPRTLVSFVLLPDILSLRRMRGKTLVCELMHSIECPCLFGANAESKLTMVNQTIEEYRRAERELINSGRYDTRDDFTVVLQTFTEEAITEEMRDERGELVMDMSLFSVDCFHLSQKGNAFAANALWNNMFEPVGQKSNKWSPEFKEINCPTKKMPYIFTEKNTKEFMSRK